MDFYFIVCLLIGLFFGYKIGRNFVNKILENQKRTIIFSDLWYGSRGNKNESR